jgi:hypothetical protein
VFKDLLFMNRKYQIAVAVAALALVVVLLVVYAAGRFFTSTGRPALPQTVTITVAGGKEFRTLLNSHKDFRSPETSPSSCRATPGGHWRSSSARR